jgi:hypothetical protein
MRGNRRRVEIEDDLPRCGAGRPRPRTGLSARRSQAVKLSFADRQQHSPRRRDRRDVPEQRRLGAQRDQIRDAASAVGQRHRQIAEHPPGIVRRAALARLGQRPSQRVGQPQPVRRQRQQRRPGTRRQARAVRPDFYLPDAGTSHHLQGAPPERERRGLDNHNSPCSGGRFSPRLKPRRPAILANRGQGDLYDDQLSVERVRRLSHPRGHGASSWTPGKPGSRLRVGADLTSHAGSTPCLPRCLP